MGKSSESGRDGWRFSVGLRLKEHGPVVVEEPVTDGDLRAFGHEVWLAAWLRRGHPEVKMDQLKVDVQPTLGNGEARKCSGFVVKAGGPFGETIQRAFSIMGLDPVAARASRRLVADGVLKAGDLYYYELLADRNGRGAPPQAASRGPTFTVIEKNPPLAYLRVRLGPLLKRAEAVGSVASHTWMPVLYTVDALTKAERFARKGADADPPRETGGVLIGPLCSCPEMGEFFSVVTDVLELVEAHETEATLTYSAETWLRIQNILKARQAQPATRADRLSGTTHGHNFGPAEGETPCSKCEKQAKCERTSVFVSASDLAWSRAVFADQPWGVSHIFGSDARGASVQALFGFHDGRLLSRGFYVVSDFDPGKP